MLNALQINFGDIFQSFVRTIMLAKLTFIINIPYILTNIIMFVLKYLICLYLNI